MLDKNGMEIKTGMVVEIKDAFFKNDNGLYFVEHSAGDPDWCGSDHSLRKISKRGKISQAKHNLCFWPIGIFISDRFKAAEARTWNKEHAFEAAVEKTVGAYEKMEKAIFSDDKEDFKRCHADYCRYIDLFSKATGIPESQFIEIVNDAALKKKDQSKSE